MHIKEYAMALSVPVMFPNLQAGFHIGGRGANQEEQGARLRKWLNMKPMGRPGPTVKDLVQQKPLVKGRKSRLNAVRLLAMVVANL